MEQNGNDILPYAAFLRGINVGGKRSIKMAELRTAFAAQGFTNVKTVLASGNVLFDTAETDAAVLCKAIEQHLKQEFGHKIFVLLRTVAELQCLVAANPFKEIAATPQDAVLHYFSPRWTNRRQRVVIRLPQRWICYGALDREGGVQCL